MTSLRGMSIYYYIQQCRKLEREIAELKGDVEERDNEIRRLKERYEA